MKQCFIVALAWVLVHAMPSLLPAATVGSTDMVGIALAGVGETAPQEGTDYPDFAVKGRDNYSYLIFGGNYSSANWTSWVSQTYYLKFGYSTAADGLWLGFAVGAPLDVTGDGNNDVLIGDIHYLDVCDPADAKGKAWLVHDVVYTQLRPTVTLSAGGGGNYCVLTQITSDQAGNWFGCSMGWAGNMNKADQDDFIVGASLWDDTTNSKTDVGRAYIFLGDDSMPNSLDTDDGVAFTGENQYDHFGCSVVGIDGFDGASTDAVVVGASWYDSRTEGGAIDKNNCGRVYIFKANANLSAMSAADADIIITGGDDDNFFGCALASGDFVSGGGKDLAVGAYGYDGYKGRVYVFSAATLLADADGLVNTGQATWTLTGSAALDLFGSSLANAGDFFNESGRDALIVGAPGYTDGSNAMAGRAYVYDMNDNPPGAECTITGTAAAAAYGKAVAGLGAVDSQNSSSIKVGVGSDSKVVIYDKN